MREIARRAAMRYEEVSNGTDDHMEIVAHGLVAAAVTITARRTTTARLRLGWTVFLGRVP